MSGIATLAAAGLLCLCVPAAAASHDNSRDSMFGYPLAFDTRDLSCDGSSKVQLLYGYISGKRDGYSTAAPLIRETAADISGILNSEAAIHSGDRFGSRIRYACASDGIPSVQHAGAFSSTLAISRQLCNKGYASSSRTYILFLEGERSSYSTRACHARGHAVVSVARNFLSQPTIATSVALHEALHLFGAVNVNAPNRYGGHCRDGQDVMCYGPEVASVCTDRFWVDCNGDDYFDPTPTPGSWLANNPQHNIGLCSEVFTDCTYRGSVP